MLLDAIVHSDHLRKYQLLVTRPISMNRIYSAHNTYRNNTYLCHCSFAILLGHCTAAILVMVALNIREQLNKLIIEVSSASVASHVKIRNLTTEHYVVDFRESMVDGLRDQLIPPASLLETRRWAGGILLVTQAINHGLPFSAVNYLFKIYLIHKLNSICFQMLCYSRCVRHVCFGINGPITAQLSNGRWLLLSFTFPYTKSQ